MIVELKRDKIIQTTIIEYILGNIICYFCIFLICIFVLCTTHKTCAKTTNFVDCIM